MQRLHVLEASQRERNDTVLRTAAQYDILIAVADGAHGFTDGVVCGRAGRNRAVVFALEAEAHGQMRGDDIGNEFGDGKGRDAAGAFTYKLFDLGLGYVQTADARTVDDTGAIRVEGTRSQSGLVNGLLSGSDGKVRALVHALGLSALDVLRDVEVLDLGGQLDLVVGHVKAGDAADAARARSQRLPIRRNAHPDRGDRAHAGNYKFCLIQMVHHLS